MAFLKVDKIFTELSHKPILSSISFELQAGQRFVLAGETGSGKSSLLKVIAGLVQPSRGEVKWKCERVQGPAERLVPGHPAIAYLSQQFELPRFLRVEQVLEYANHFSDSMAAKIFRICKIAHLLKRKTDELSGGEKQRIAIARLLIQQPELLLLDEPYAHLDMHLKVILKEVVNDICRKLGITCILVSHHPDDTLPWADSILVLKKGRIVQTGTPMEIYREPRDAYVAGLFGEFNVLDAASRRKLAIPPSASKFIRPENLTVGKTKKIISGNVVSCAFDGSHYLIDVVTKAGKNLLVYNSRRMEKNSAVNVGWTPAQ